jgi:uncharacterized cupin superfamily protein
MKKINTNTIKEISRVSPKGKFGRHVRNVSEALGREPESSDLLKRHPFDVQISRIEPGKTLCPFHSHGAQWELYIVISGTGLARDAGGTTPIEPGDAFVFKPGEAHTLTNNGEADLVFYTISDNPMHETCYYPDSKKWAVELPEDRIMRSEPLNYFDGEE